MSDTTKIEWCDHTASPWHGCTHGVYIDASGNEHEHPGCGRCYAEKMAKRNPGTLGVWGTDGTRIMSASFHANCRRWNKAAEKAGVPATVFPSICDPFEDWDGPILRSDGTKAWSTIGMGSGAPLTMSDLRRDLFATIDACPWLRFLLLTKRPGNIRRFWSMIDTTGKSLSAHRPNVALIASISDQATADAMVPDLLACRDLCPTLGVSAEPLLSDIDLRRIAVASRVRKDSPLTPINEVREVNALTGERLVPVGTGAIGYSGPVLDWVIVGGESGPSARPCDVAWIRSIIEQCREAGVACFVKQLGSNVRCGHEKSDLNQSMISRTLGSTAKCLTCGFVYPRDPKGGDIEEFPPWARVREYPLALKGLVTA